MLILKKRKSIEKRREEVFLIISQIIAEKGFSEVSTSEIAKKLGVSQPAIYKYFKNKDEMIIYFLDTLNHKLQEILQRAKNEKTIKSKIKVIYKEHLEFIERTKIMPRVVFSDVIYLGNLRKREKLKDAIFSYTIELKNLFREGIKNKEMKDIDPEIIVRFFIGSLMSSALKWMLSDMNYSLSEEANNLFEAFEKAFFN